MYCNLEKPDYIANEWVHLGLPEVTPSPACLPCLTPSQGLRPGPAPPGPRMSSPVVTSPLGIWGNTLPLKATSSLQIRKPRPWDRGRVAASTPRDVEHKRVVCAEPGQAGSWGVTEGCVL